MNIKIGGATRDRTADPLLAKQVLSQLSYSPTRVHNCTRYLFQCNKMNPREFGSSQGIENDQNLKYITFRDL